MIPVTALPDLSLEILDQILFERPKACEGEYHSRGISGHCPDDPAAYYVISPCHGCKVVQCEGRVEQFKASGLIRCFTCEVVYRFEEFRFVPIDSL